MECKYRHLVALAVCACLMVLSCGQFSQGQFRSYHIGNSLTWDSQPLAMDLFGNEFGPDHVAGLHIHGGWAIHTIVGDPNSVTADPVPEFGKFTEALPSHQWDAVTLQSHISQDANLQSDVDSMLTLIDLARSNPANSDTVFYLYQAWSNRLAPGTVSEKWIAPLSGSPNPDMEHSREYYDLLLQTLKDSTDAEIRTIPVGEVLYQLDLDMKQGQVPGYTAIEQVFKDFTHLNNELGRYIASATTFATFSGIHPLNLYKPPGFVQKNLYPISQEVYDAVNTVIRDVLNAETDSGVYFPVADFDGNDLISTRDLALWNHSYPGSQYDIDQDGTVSGLDFLKWQQDAGFIQDGFDDKPANLNGVGLVDTEDIRVWEASYGVDNLADLDGDGESTGFDFLELQREITPYLRTDVNRDRMVNGRDLLPWEASVGYSGVVDADADNRATGLDFLTWQREYGMNTVPVTTNVGVVPEPHGLALALSAFLLSLLRTIRDS